MIRFRQCWPVGHSPMSVFGVSVGAISERHQLEWGVLDFLAVGVVKPDVGDEPEARLVSSFVGVGFLLCLKSAGLGCTLVVDVLKVSVPGSLESEDAEEACPLVWRVSLIDDDVGGIGGVVGASDGTPELRSVGRLVAIGMWLLGDVRG